jgi:transcriptional regulator with XRE-family HTH domain
MHRRIRKLRAAKGISQARFAHKLNINYTQYNKYETGKVKIPSELLISISKLLGVTTDYLLTGGKEVPSPSGMLKDEVFSQLLEALTTTEPEHYSDEELAMLRGAAKLIIERLEQKRITPKKK